MSCLCDPRPSRPWAWSAVRRWPGGGRGPATSRLPAARAAARRAPTAASSGRTRGSPCRWCWSRGRCDSVTRSALQRNLRLVDWEGSPRRNCPVVTSECPGLSPTGAGRIAEPAATLAPVWPRRRLLIACPSRDAVRNRLPAMTARPPPATTTREASSWRTSSPRSSGSRRIEKARLRNKAVKSSLKTSVRKFREAADAGEPTRPRRAARRLASARQGREQRRHPRQPGGQPQVGDGEARPPRSDPDSTKGVTPRVAPFGVSAARRTRPAAMTSSPDGQRLRQAILPEPLCTALRYPVTALTSTDAVPRTAPLALCSDSSPNRLTTRLGHGVRRDRAVDLPRRSTAKVDGVSSTSSDPSDDAKKTSR